MSAEQTRARRLADLLLDGRGSLLIRRIDAAAELCRLEASERELLTALEVAHVRCTSKDYDRFAALIAKTKEVRG